MRPSRPGSLVAVALLSLVFALAGCEAEPSKVVEPDFERPAGPIAPAAIDHRFEHVDTQLGWATVRFDTSLCLEDLSLVRTGTPLSDLLVRHLSGESVFGVYGPSTGAPPHFPAALGSLLEPYGMLSNFEFLIGDLPQSGPVDRQIGDAVSALVADLETTTGWNLEVEAAGGYVGTETYNLLGGVVLSDDTLIPVEDPDYEARIAGLSDGTLVTGDATIDLYVLEFEVRYVGNVPGGACLTARSQKQAARDLLLPHATHPEKKVRKRIEKALDRLERSLDPALWVDDTHLDSKMGKKVFDHEKKAAHEILKLLKKATDGDDDSSDDDSSDAAYDLAPATIADLEAALGKMLAADRALASMAIAEVDCAGDGKCAKELAKAGEKSERAERYAAEGRIDRAVGEFKKAWEKAIEAASRL